jgi:hypothetical protein
MFPHSLFRSMKKHGGMKRQHEKGNQSQEKPSVEVG